MLVEEVGDFLRASATAHIDDGRAGNGIQNMQQFGVFVGGFAPDIGQIFPLKTHFIDLELAVGVDGEKVLNVLHHAGRGGGGEGEDGNAPLSPPRWGR